jgi:oligoribonuclease NrnB/cAMP/cGMP phosphodiesterase (DHH superfamily)
MKTVCIYHSIDLDGWMSAALVKHWFNKQEVPNKEGEDCNTIDFIGYSYGQPIPDLSEYDKVIMSDISFPKEEMKKLSIRLQYKFIWIDHHISAIKQWDEGEMLPAGFRDVDFAACELTWMYFFDRKESDTMPEIVRLLGRYDCFGHKNTDEEQKVLEFQYGARSYITNYEGAYQFLVESLDDVKINTTIQSAGINIYSYLCTEAERIYKNGFEIIFYWVEDKGTNVPAQKTAKFIAINRRGFNPTNFGVDYHKEGYDGCASFWYTNEMWHFTLYNANGDVDCSEIAKSFGGGGHAGASGFDTIDINQFIT